MTANWPPPPPIAAEMAIAGAQVLLLEMVQVGAGITAHFGERCLPVFACIGVEVASSGPVLSTYRTLLSSRCTLQTDDHDHGNDNDGDGNGNSNDDAAAAATDRSF